MLNTWHPNVKKINVIHIPFPQELIILETPSGAQTLACGTLLQGMSYSSFFDNFYRCHGVCEGHAIPYFMALQLDAPRKHCAILYVDREESPYHYQNGNSSLNSLFKNWFLGWNMTSYSSLKTNF
jgi:hypothetical protein